MTIPRDTLERQAERIQKLEAVMLRLLDRVTALEGGRRPVEAPEMPSPTDAPLLPSGEALAGVGVKPDDDGCLACQ